MEDAGAIPMAIRRGEKAAPPPAQPPGRRRRSSIAATGAAWPAFPREANAGAGVGGLGAAKRSPAASGGNGDGGASKSPSSSGFSPVSFGGGGSVSGGVGVGTGARSASSCGGCKVSGCGGVRSPGIVRKTSACCNSCRPSAAHHNNQHQQHGKGENGGRIEYDDVFGGPPKYLASTCNGRKMSIPDYDDIFRTTNPRSFSSIAQQPVRTKSRTAELPVFDPPEYDTEVFRGPPAEKPRSPATIAYEDVFGGPLTGPRTRLLKDLLRCSGASDSKWKSGSNKGSSQSDCSFQSPISSMHSASHGNPIYEFESEVFGDAKDFKGSSFGSVGKSPQAYVEPESIRKPVMTSVSASSSPFTEYFDDSTVHSYSSRASKNANDRVVQLDYEKMYRNVPQPVHDVNKDFVVEPDMEVASSSSTESFELEFTKRASSKKAFGNNHRKRRDKKSFSALKRPSTVEAEDASPLQTSSNVVSPEVESLHMPATVTYFQSGTFGNERHEDVYAATRGDRETDDFDLEQPNQPSIKCFSAQADEDLQHFKLTDVASKREAKQVSFITVNHVKLTTEPTNVPPARPAPSRNLEVMSEKEMSELLETEAFMEYSIKDLDGLVAEEYLVSQESVSDSSPSSLSVSNSLKTSASGRSYEDEDSEHSYAEDSILGVEGKATEGKSVPKLERRPVKRPLPKQQLHKREKELETERNSYGRDKKDKVQQAKFPTEEEEINGPAIQTKQDTKSGQSVMGDSVVLERESAETMKEQVADSFPEDSTDELGRSKSSSEELISSSSSSFEEQMFPKGAPLSDDWSSLCVPEFEDIEGETPERRRSRQERHQRALERVAKVLAEKNNRELERERAEAEKQRVAEVLDDVIKRWAAGKQGNLRALLSTLQYILWPECGWQPVSLMDIIEPAFVRKAYRKATLCVHPDKLQQKGASIEHKYIAEKVFDHLQEAWTIFNYEQLF